MGSDDRTEHGDRTADLHRLQRLAEDQPSGGRGDDRAEEAEEAGRGDRQRLDAAEPVGVGEAGSDDGEPREADDVRGAQAARDTLERQDEWQQEQPAGGQLPAGEGDEADGATPALGEDDAGGHRHRAGERGGEADRIEPCAGLQDEHRHADEPDHAGDGVPSCEPLAEQHGGQGGGDQRLERAGRRRHTAGQPERSDEQQGEERADVQDAEHGGAPPPGAGRQPTADDDEGEADGKRSDGGGEQRSAGGQQLGGDQVGGAPHGRGQGGQRRGAAGGQIS